MLRLPPVLVVGLPFLPLVQPINRAEAFDDPAFIVEPKLDGFRGQFYLKRGSSKFLSKSSKPQFRFSKFGDRIAAELHAHGIEEIVLDGEIIARDANHRESLASLQIAGAAIRYAVFDILWWQGEDYRPFSLEIRKQFLDTLFTARFERLELLRPESLGGVAAFRRARKRDREGIVMKRRSDPYDENRACWYKIKNPEYSQRSEGERLFGRAKRRGGR